MLRCHIIIFDKFERAVSTLTFYASFVAMVK